MFDVTLAYPGVDISLWKFLSGQVPRIVVHVREVPMPREFFTDAVTEPGPQRDAFKRWVGDVWERKDALLSDLAAE